MRHLSLILAFLLFANQASASINLIAASSQYLESSVSTINTGLNGSTGWTICAKVNSTYSATNSTYMIATKYKDGASVNSAFNLRFTDTGNQKTFVFQGNYTFSTGSYNTQIVQDFPYGTYAVCEAWSRSAGDATDFTYMVNGQFYTGATQLTNSGTYNNTATQVDNAGFLTLGERLQTGSAHDRFFNGQMSEVAIWSVVLTRAQMMTYYNNAMARACDLIANGISNASLLLDWPMDDVISGSVSTNPINKGSVAVTMNRSGTPTWNPQLTCGNTLLNNAQIQQGTINGGAQ